MTQLNNLRGVIRGRIIELEQEPDVPSGQNVVVDLVVPEPAAKPGPHPLEELAGALADFGDEIDEFNRWYREARHADRPPLDPAQ